MSTILECIKSETKYNQSYYHSFITIGNPITMMITSVHHYIWLILILLDHTRAANNNQPVDNAQPPGTAAPNHIEYNGDGDAFGCQNMCYYYYCLGQSNYL